MVITKTYVRKHVPQDCHPIHVSHDPFHWKISVEPNLNKLKGHSFDILRIYCMTILEGSIDNLSLVNNCPQIILIFLSDSTHLVFMRYTNHMADSSASLLCNLLKKEENWFG